MMTVGDEVLTLRREVGELRREVAAARADNAALLAEVRRHGRRVADHDKALTKTATLLEWLLVVYAGKTHQQEKGRLLLEVDAVRSLAVEDTEEDE